MSTEITNCECSFPKFRVIQGIYTCRWCELPDHYKDGVVSDWSDGDDDETKSVESHDELDDHGVMCHYSRTTGGWEAIEPFCVECGYGKGKCECIKCEEEEDEEEYCAACGEYISYEDDKKIFGMSVCNPCYEIEKYDFK